MSPIIDAHCHLFQYGYHGDTADRFPSKDAETEEYESLRRRFDIRYSLVIGYDEDDYIGNSQYIARVTRSIPGLIPLKYSKAGEPLSKYASAYPSGAEHCRLLARQLREQQNLGTAPRILSLNVRPAVIGGLHDAISEVTGTWVLISHMGLPGYTADSAAAAGILRDVLAFAEFPNVTVKISGQYAASKEPSAPHRDTQPAVDLLAEHFGTDRLVWGSDFSPCLDVDTFAQAVDCVLPSGADDDDRRKIMFGNADRLLREFAGKGLM